MGFRGVVVGLTGNATVDDIQAFVAHGANACVTKPVKAAELLNVLEEHLGS